MEIYHSSNRKLRESIRIATADGSEACSAVSRLQIHRGSSVNGTHGTEPALWSHLESHVPQGSQETRFLSSTFRGPWVKRLEGH